MTARYGCGGDERGACSFATSDRARMLAHWHATGHTVEANETSALDDRRQRAREAGQDARDDEGRPIDTYDMIDVAIETATRVQVTPEVIEAFVTAWGATESGPARRDNAIIAAFRAAGFEVEQ